MNYIVLTEVILPIRWSSMYIHVSLAHGSNHCHRHAEIFFDDSQVANGLQAAKQHSRPFCGLANKATIHRPCSYGFETVIVLSGDFIQGRPGAFTHRRFYTQKLLHEAFTHRSFLHADAFAHKSFYTQELLHKEAFTHRSVYTQALLHTDAFTHRRFYTQTLLHTEALTHRSFYTQTLLHTEAFTHRGFYTQKLLHTEAFTHRSFYTDTFTHRSAILPQFATIEAHFVRKGCRRGCKIATLPQILAIELHVVRKGCRRGCKIAILPQFLVIKPRFVRKGCISCRLVGTAPRLKREIEKQEGARGQEGKRARGQERM